MKLKKSTKTGKNFRGGEDFSGWPEYIPLYFYMLLSIISSDSQGNNKNHTLNPPNHFHNHIQEQCLNAQEQIYDLNIIPTCKNKVYRKWNIYTKTIEIQRGPFRS